VSLAYHLLNLTRQAAAIRQALKQFDQTLRGTDGETATGSAGGMDRYGGRSAWSSKLRARVMMMMMMMKGVR
jgi:hypothetical protein